jgi:hypothetical protein
MKKTIAAVLTLLLCFLILPSAAFADEEGEPVLTPAEDGSEVRVTIGANLDETQIAQIYKDFGVERGSVTEIIVTNADERAYLEGIAPERKIGSVALSCIYIKTLPEGEGLKISTNNINWCTSEMYMNALVTAGITDAEVKVSAPFDVSGTAALTGIYKAYEDITGTTLSEIAKTIGVEELVTTGELAEYIGSEEAIQIVNELKKILDQTQNMTDDEVRAEIKSIAEAYNVSITDAQVEQLLKLCRSLEKLDIKQLQDKLVSLTKTLEGAKKVESKLSEFANSIKTFFGKIGDFFSRLFGGGN